MLAPWGRQSGDGIAPEPARPAPANRAKGKKADATGVAKPEAPATSKAKPPSKRNPVSDKAASEDAEAAAPEGSPPEREPELLTAPRGGQADDLKRISGVGPKLEGVLNDLGFYHFDQIANWTEAEIAWVDNNLEGFKGRVSRDAWVEQARLLAEGKETEFSTRVKKGEVY